MLKNMDNIARINNFVSTLSTERFDRYLKLANKDKELALDLYVGNACLSQALYIPLQALEVTLRNAIHTQLSHDIGEYWFDKPNVLLFNKQLEMIGEAKSKLLHEKKYFIASRVVAALSLSFWTSMFKPMYDQLWKKNLYEIITLDSRKGLNRKSFSGPLEPIRQIRNRIAHHECIVESDLKNHYSQIKLLIGRLSPEAKYWMEINSTFDKVYKEQQAILSKLHERKLNGTTSTAV